LGEGTLFMKNTEIGDNIINNMDNMQFRKPDLQRKYKTVYFV